MEGLDEEISAIKIKTEEINKIHVNWIKSLMERINEQAEEQ
jgi:hypothetical protein